MAETKAARWPEHAREHLRASGLDLRDAARLGLRWCSRAEVSRRLGLTERQVSCGGIFFPYHDAAGGPLSFGRVRLLPDPREGWRTTPTRYLQPAGSGLRAYLPPLVDWSKIQKNGAALLVTEGEKKAAAACKAGFPTIGVGGIWCFAQKGLGVDLLPDLEAFAWAGRDVTVAYDSDDSEEKASEVRKAGLELARRLQDRGARVSFLALPTDADGRKQGLDDYLVAFGRKALADRLAEAAPLDPAEEALRAYRERFILVRTLSCAFDRETGTLYSRPKLRDAFPEERVMVLGPTGRPRHLTKAEAWWDDPRKQTASRQVLRPGEPEITSEGDLNLFRGWGAPPEEGDASIWEELLSLVLQDDRRAMRWLEQWLAYPLQHPGAKLHQCVFVWGGQGVGKSSIGRILLDIYGPSGRAVQDRELFTDYNAWIAHTLFALGDDLSFDERRKSRSVLKHLVDSETVEVNPKYVQSYAVENRCNLYLTANSPASVPLDPSGLNRRFFIVEAPEIRPREKAWYTGTFDRWRREGGARAVHHRLLHLSLSGFHPQQDAPETRGKALVVESGRSGVEEWIATQLLGACPYQLTTAREVHALYRAATSDHRTGIGLLTATLRQAATPLGQHRVGEAFVSLWALRERERWEKARARERVRQYQQERSGGA